MFSRGWNKNGWHSFNYPLVITFYNYVDNIQVESMQKVC